MNRNITRDVYPAVIGKFGNTFPIHIWEALNAECSRTAIKMLPAALLKTQAQIMVTIMIATIFIRNLPSWNGPNATGPLMIK